MGDKDPLEFIKPERLEKIVEKIEKFGEEKTEKQIMIEKNFREFKTKMKKKFLNYIFDDFGLFDKDGNEIIELNDEDEKKWEENWIKFYNPEKIEDDLFDYHGIKDLTFEEVEEYLEALQEQRETKIVKERVIKSDLIKKLFNSIYEDDPLYIQNYKRIAELIFYFSGLIEEFNITRKNVNLTFLSEKEKNIIKKIFEIKENILPNNLEIKNIGKKIAHKIIIDDNDESIILKDIQIDIGNGLFVTKNIPNKTTLGRIAGKVFFDAIEKNIYESEHSDDKDFEIIKIEGDLFLNKRIIWIVQTGHWSIKANHKWSFEKNIKNKCSKQIQKVTANVIIDQPSGHIITIRDIEKGEEISWDYGFDYWKTREILPFWDLKVLNLTNNFENSCLNVNNQIFEEGDFKYFIFLLGRSLIRFPIDKNKNQILLSKDDLTKVIEEWEEQDFNLINLKRKLIPTLLPEDEEAEAMKHFPDVVKKEEEIEKKGKEIDETDDDEEKELEELEKRELEEGKSFISDEEELEKEESWILYDTIKKENGVYSINLKNRPYPEKLYVKELDLPKYLFGRKLEKLDVDILDLIDERVKNDSNFLESLSKDPILYVSNLSDIDEYRKSKIGESLFKKIIKNPNQKNLNELKVLEPREKKFQVEIIPKKGIKFENCVDENLGNWIPIKKIGQGRYGTVYQACHRDHCQYVIKIINLNKETKTNEGKLSKKAGELEIGPKIFRYGICKTDDKNWFFMIAQKINGKTLSSLRKTYPYNYCQYIEESLKLYYKLLQNKIDHRDLHSGNIMIENKTNKVYIIDYGLAKLITLEKTNLKERFKRAVKNLLNFLFQESNNFNINNDINKFTSYINCHIIAKKVYEEIIKEDYGNILISDWSILEILKLNDEDENKLKAFIIEKIETNKEVENFEKEFENSNELQEKKFQVEIILKGGIKFENCVDEQLGKWIPIKEIGKGFEGKVYQACDKNSCQYVIKITNLFKKTISEEGKLSKIAGELGIGAKIYKYGICKTDDNNWFYLIAQKINGETLEEKYPYNCDYVRKALELYYKLLENNIEHNDFHDENIIIEEKTNRVYIIDYGLSQKITIKKKSLPLSQEEFNLKDIFKGAIKKLLQILFDFSKKFMNDDINKFKGYINCQIIAKKVYKEKIGEDLDIIHNWGFLETLKIDKDILKLFITEKIDNNEEIGDFEKEFKLFSIKKPFKKSSKGSLKKEVPDKFWNKWKEQEKSKVVQSSYHSLRIKILSIFYKLNFNIENDNEDDEEEDDFDYGVEKYSETAIYFWFNIEIYENMFDKLVKSTNKNRPFDEDDNEYNKNWSLNHTNVIQNLQKLFDSKEIEVIKAIEYIEAENAAEEAKNDALDALDALKLRKLNK